MTPEEIDVALARAGGEQTALVPAGQQNATSAAAAAAQYRPALPPGGPGYGYPYAQQQLPPPEYVSPLWICVWMIVDY